MSVVFADTIREKRTGQKYTTAVELARLACQEPTPFLCTERAIKLRDMFKKMPRASFSMMQRRLKSARMTADKVVTDECVRDAVTQVLADINVSRMWFCVFRVLADVGYLPKGDYEALRVRMDELFPDNDFSINPRDISRMDVESFSKGFQLWNEHNAPVTGKRFKDYRNLAENFYRLIKA